jgi:hypothetical protein
MTAQKRNRYLYYRIPTEKKQFSCHHPRFATPVQSPVPAACLISEAPSVLSSSSRVRLGLRRMQGRAKMNDSPHLLAIIESKMAQVRTRLEHNSVAKAQALLMEVEIYADELRSHIRE